MSKDFDILGKFTEADAAEYLDFLLYKGFYRPELKPIKQSATMVINPYNVDIGLRAEEIAKELGIPARDIYVKGGVLGMLIKLLDAAAWRIFSINDDEEIEKLHSHLPERQSGGHARALTHEEATGLTVELLRLTADFMETNKEGNLAVNLLKMELAKEATDA